MVKVLYLTQDGITDHIGQAQIAPYLLGLARLGHQIHIVSAEKPGREQLRARYETLFENAGIKWTTVPYANRPPLISSFVVLWRMYRRAKAVVAAEGQQVLHCRAYLPLEIAVLLKRRFNMKLLVDFRDFWADVGIEKKPFKFVFRALKRREPDYIGAADHIVTLTDRAADILMDWYPSAVGGDRSRYQVIPCCADFEHFSPADIDPAEVEANRRALGLTGEGPVLLYLGSIGHDYLLPDMMRLFKALLELKPTAKFLFMSNNGAELVERERIGAGIPAEAIRFTSATREQVPPHIALADLSVVFIRPTLSKAGCSPTKLAELFALNVPVIANSGVGDLDEILDLARNGSVIVRDMEPETLRAALRQVLSLRPAERAQIRARSADMSLEEGVRRYARIYDLFEEQLAREAAHVDGRDQRG
jgi:glycosyltransferase involved in cell wall biosynthesis